MRVDFRPVSSCVLPAFLPGKAAPAAVKKAPVRTAAAAHHSQPAAPAAPAEPDPQLLAEIAQLQEQVWVCTGRENACRNPKPLITSFMHI